MASVDKTVRSSIIAYPMLNSTRTEVLHFILCVIGNGYEWHNGEALPKFEDDEVLSDPDGPVLEQFEANHRKHVERMERIYPDANIWRILGLKEQLKEEREEALEILRNLDNRVQEWTSLDREPYPQRGSALLMNIPDDVTDDWREACEKMKTIVAEKGWVF